VGCTIHVIASEAKQSIPPHEERMDCFVASASRNDEQGVNPGHDDFLGATASKHRLASRPSIR
jgi:hypothetical protein